MYPVTYLQSITYLVLMLTENLKQLKIWYYSFYLKAQYCRNECYKYMGGRWLSAPSMKESRQYFTMTSFDDFILVTGGDSNSE